MKIKFLLAAAFAAAVATMPARAEVNELRVAKQYGLGYLQLILMEDQKLIEKQAQAAGLGDLKVSWNTFRSSDVMNDALLSGSVDFVCLGPPGLSIIWAKTAGTAQEVKGASGLNSLPLFLNTREERIKSIRDLTDKDRIALPAVKVSVQAIMLQMAAVKEFGEANYARLDPLTVSMAHPDGLATFLSGAGEINNHFTSPPFQYRELARPGVRKLTSSYDIIGTKGSFNVIAATTKFRTANPKVYGVFNAALAEATAMIARDKPGVAQTYLRVTQDKSPPEEILAMLNDPDIEFHTVPKGLQQIADFMYKVGTIKTKPASWKDLLHDNLHGQPGS
jgi:NitT/TauT family transport system substrate-binding protein